MLTDYTGKQMFFVAEKKRKKNILSLQAITINVLTSKAILFLYSKTFNNFEQTN